MGKFIKTFQNIIEEYAEQSKDLKLLPLCHTSKVGYILSIIHSKALKSKKRCPVYDELLVYFFYGKSSYLVQKEMENLTNNPPITLIYDLDKLNQFSIKRLLPFDSGGFERYKMREGFDKDQFTYEEPTFDIIKSMLKLLYNDNENYFKNQVNLNELKKHEDECIEIQEIINLYENVKNGNREVAQQVHSIEVQFERLNEVLPQYVILPYDFFTSKFWENFRNEFPAINVDHYGEKEISNNFEQTLSGSDYMRLMKQKVIDVIK